MEKTLTLLILLLVSPALSAPSADPSIYHNSPDPTYADILAATASAYSVAPAEHVEHLEQHIVEPVPVVNTQFHAQTELGEYSYGYSNPTSSKVETKTADGVVEGSYSYLSPDGRIITNNYASDPRFGFRSSLAPSNGEDEIIPLIAEPVIQPALIPAAPVEPAVIAPFDDVVVAEAYNNVAPVAEVVHHHHVPAEIVHHAPEVVHHEVYNSVAPVAEVVHHAPEVVHHQQHHVGEVYSSPPVAEVVHHRQHVVAAAVPEPVVHHHHVEEARPFRIHPAVPELPVEEPYVRRIVAPQPQQQPRITFRSKPFTYSSSSRFFNPYDGAQNGFYSGSSSSTSSRIDPGYYGRSYSRFYH